MESIQTGGSHYCTVVFSADVCTSSKLTRLAIELTSLHLSDGHLVSDARAGEKRGGRGCRPSTMSTPGSPRTPAYEAAPLFAEDVLEDGLLSFPIAALPSLPQPNRHALSSEVARGIGLIGWCVAATVGNAHGLAWLVENEPATFWSPVLFSTHVQAVAALVAHANLLLREPGFVQRSRESCLPVPPVVAERLRAGDTLSGLANVRNESDGASYCVRCCVWRPDPPPPADRAPTLFTQWLWKDLPSVARRCPCSGARPAHHCAVCQVRLTALLKPPDQPTAHTHCASDRSGAALRDGP